MVQFHRKPAIAVSGDERRAIPLGLKAWEGAASSMIRKPESLPAACKKSSSSRYDEREPSGRPAGFRPCL